MSQPLNSEELVSADIEMRVGPHRLHLKLAAPVAPVPPQNLLPVARQLADTFVDQAVADVREQGLQISCKKGCGTCCRQLVKISPAEAWALRDLVEAMPEPRRTQVLERFADAHRRLRESGLWNRFEDFEEWTQSTFVPLAYEYFSKGIACPFLEEESCSIYPDRPVICREFLVVTPAEYCANPAAGKILSLRLPIEMAPVMARLGASGERDTGERWIPLILALDWANAHNEPPVRPGLEWLQELLETMSGKKIPAPASRGA